MYTLRAPEVHLLHSTQYAQRLPFRQSQTSIKPPATAEQPPVKAHSSLPYDSKTPKHTHKQTQRHQQTAKTLKTVQLAASARPAASMGRAKLAAENTADEQQPLDNHQPAVPRQHSARRGSQCEGYKTLSDQHAGAGAKNV
jgi:hypothetical protein